ncbi:MAG: NADH-quinone oxidoreductase subunit D [Ignavibacteria bacterium]|jgi:NADH-quinone oxidoreductase subunit D|nr:NADH-quinone oxidoreductase subunit D [Ignavibacteria bacterium]
MNITTAEELKRIHTIRQDKIYKKLLQKDTTFEPIDPLENEMVLNMGPQHPATHGVLRILLKISGETVVKAIPEVGYLHRGMEKLAENMGLHEFIPFTDRLDYMSPLANNIGYVLACENALGIEAPPRAQWIRVLCAELARISSHLMAFGSFAMDAGAVSMLVWCFTEREKIYDIIELMTGARFTVSHQRIGGVAFDISDETIALIRQFLEQFPEQFNFMKKVILRNRIFIERLSGTCVITPERAVALGVTGPPLRACGIPKDVRRDQPYLVYDELDFDVITENDCDNWARCIVRLREVEESYKMIKQVLDKIPQGEIRLKNTKTTFSHKKEVYTKMEELISDFVLVNFGGSIPVGQTYTAIEGSKGEFGFFIVSNGEGHPWKVKIHSPSSANLQCLSELVEGSMISDVVLAIGSLDPIMGEVDK